MAAIFHSMAKVQFQYGGHSSGILFIVRRYINGMHEYVISRGRGRIDVRAVYSNHLGSLRTQDGRLLSLCPYSFLPHRAYSLWALRRLALCNRNSILIECSQNRIHWIGVLEKGMQNCTEAIFFLFCHHYVSELWSTN